jgi:hypothetical protein
MRTAIIYSLILVCSVNAILAMGFENNIVRQFLIILRPGAIVIWSWAPVHYLWAFLLVQLVNVVFYFFVLWITIIIYSNIARGMPERLRQGRKNRDSN